MIDILFDQFQRYNNVTNIINTLRKTGQTFNILEVGANEHQNLERFLPEDQITYLDISLPENLKNNPKYILGDATSMGFSDNHYNIVVALDVFEHIAEQDRIKFVSELHRVSSDFFIITAPFHSPKVVQAEKRVNAVFKSLFNKDFIWLEEHMTNGLPNIDRLSNYLDSNDMQYKLISHGDIDIWERMMAIHFITAHNPALTVYRQEIDRFYNQHIYGIDYIDDSYRKICVVAKNCSLSELIMPNPEVDSVKNRAILEKFDVLERTFFNLASVNTGVLLNKKKEDSFQVFWNNGNGFNEINSIREKVVSSTCHFEKRIDLALMESIRIDPSDFRGAFRFSGILIKDEDGKEILEDRYSVNGNYNFNYKDMFVFYNDDPFLTINFNHEVSITDIRLSITKINDDEFKIIMIENMKKKIEEQAAHCRELSECKEKTVSLNKIVSELNQKNEDMLFENNELVIQVEKLNHLIADLNNLNKEAFSKNESLSQDIINYKEQVEEKNRELQGVYGSRSWKYVMKLKKIMGK
ncbi:methyltransferase domain-containing protein [Paenibacillus sp. IHBB 3054]|uniref:methyltransferase domain-containing protein n=1 Tax=Paenibacillus sp. IHBB 3054 TaxID=3425689 RepID=UPI003F668E03